MLNIIQSTSAGYTVICAEAAGLQVIRFWGGGQTHVGPPKNHVLDGGSVFRHLANTIERFMLVGDESFC